MTASQTKRNHRAPSWSVASVAELGDKFRILLLSHSCVHSNWLSQPVTAWERLPFRVTKRFVNVKIKKRMCSEEQEDTYAKDKQIIIFPWVVGMHCLIDSPCDDGGAFPVREASVWVCWWRKGQHKKEWVRSILWKSIYELCLSFRWISGSWGCGWKCRALGICLGGCDCFAMGLGFHWECFEVFMLVWYTEMIEWVFDSQNDKTTCILLFLIFYFEKKNCNICTTKFERNFEICISLSNSQMWKKCTILVPECCIEKHQLSQEVC